MVARHPGFREGCRLVQPIEICASRLSSSHLPVGELECRQAPVILLQDCATIAWLCGLLSRRHNIKNAQSATVLGFHFLGGRSNVVVWQRRVPHDRSKAIVLRFFDKLRVEQKNGVLSTMRGQQNKQKRPEDVRKLPAQRHH